MVNRNVDNTSEDEVGFAVLCVIVSAKIHTCLARPFSVFVIWVGRGRVRYTASFFCAGFHSVYGGCSLGLIRGDQSLRELLSFRLG